MAKELDMTTLMVGSPRAFKHCGPRMKGMRTVEGCVLVTIPDERAVVSIANSKHGDPFPDALFVETAFMNVPIADGFYCDAVRIMKDNSGRAAFRLIAYGLNTKKGRVVLTPMRWMLLNERSQAVEFVPCDLDDPELTDAVIGIIGTNLNENKERFE